MCQSPIACCSKARLRSCRPSSTVLNPMFFRPRISHRFILDRSFDRSRLVPLLPLARPAVRVCCTCTHNVWCLSCICTHAVGCLHFAHNITHISWPTHVHKVACPTACLCQCVSFRSPSVSESGDDMRCRLSIKK